MRIGIIGAGAVGSACLTACVQRRIAHEIVVVNRDRKKAKGFVTDVQYGAVLFPGTEIRDGDYADLRGAALVMITAGVNEKTGGAADRSDPAGRLRLLDTNVGVYEDIVPRLHAAAPEAIVLVVTDPPDPLADAVRKLGHDRVLSTGTYLDSRRFKFHLGRGLNVDPASVDAQILGEHGTSEVFMWSSATIGGRPGARMPVAILVAELGRVLPRHRAASALRQYRDHRRDRRQPARHRHCVGAHRRNDTTRRADRYSDRLLPAAI